MVEKTTLGIATADYSIAAYAFFGNNTQWRPSSAEERKQWADECKTTYPDLLQGKNIEKMIQSEKGKPEVMHMLSRFFSFLEEEYSQSMQFIFELNKIIYPELYSNAGAPQEIKMPIDLLYHHPDLQTQTAAMIKEAKPLSILLSRQTQHVANGKNLDQVYENLNYSFSLANPSSRLSGVGSMLGDIGTGKIAARIMPPELTDPINWSHDENLHPSYVRAQLEAKSFPPNFFANTLAFFKNKNKEREERITASHAL